MKSRRAPHGARGLKCTNAPATATTPQSRPARGAWIEIKYVADILENPDVAPRTGRVD